MWQKVLFCKTSVCLFSLNIQLDLFSQSSLQFSMIIWLSDLNGKWLGVCVCHFQAWPLKTSLFSDMLFFLFWVMGVTTPRWPWRPHVQDGWATISLDSYLNMWIRDLQGLWHFYFVDPWHVCVHFVIPAWPTWANADYNKDTKDISCPGDPCLCASRYNTFS